MTPRHRQLIRQAQAHIREHDRQADYETKRFNELVRSLAAHLNDEELAQTVAGMATDR